MMKRFTDHAANERTYLAWIRTAIAVMAFGFVIEKFDLFIRYLGHAVNDSGHPRPSEWAELFGLLFIGVSILMFLVSTSRYFAYKKVIDSEDPKGYGSRATNIMVALLVVLLVIFVVFYVGLRPGLE